MASFFNGISDKVTVSEQEFALGMPIKISVTNTAQTVTLSGKCILRNIGNDDIYFLADQATTITTANGYKIIPNDMFPILVSFTTNIQVISPSSSTLEVVTVI